MLQNYQKILHYSHIPERITSLVFQIFIIDPKIIFKMKYPYGREGFWTELGIAFGLLVLACSACRSK